MSSLILIDITCVSYLDGFVSCLLNGVDYVAFSSMENYADVKARIPNKQYENVALVQHNKGGYDYGIMINDSYDRPARLCNVSSLDPELETWVEVKGFMSWLRDTRGMKHFDLLACNIWADNDWKYVIEKLNAQLQIRVRASIDVTGLDGNFILESDNVDTIGIYFNNDIKLYPQAFFTSYNGYYNQNTDIQFDASSNATLFRSKYSAAAGSLAGLMITQLGNTTNYITQPYDISNIKQIKGKINNGPYGDNDYAVLLQDGSVVRWGNKLATMRYVSTTTDPSLNNVKRLFSNFGSFTALKNDNTIVSWGFSTHNGVNTDINVESIYNVATPVGLTDVKEIYAHNYSYWALKNDGSIVSWGGRHYSGGDTSLCSSLLVNIKKVCIWGNGYIALRTDGCVVICGEADPAGGIPCRYVTTVGNAAWSGKIEDIFPERYFLVLNNGVREIHRVYWSPTHIIANTNTMTMGSPLYTLPAGVTVTNSDFMREGMRLYLSNGKILSHMSGFVQLFDAGQLLAGEGDPVSLYLNTSGGVMNPLSTNARGGGNVRDATYGIPAGADVSSNVVQIYSCQNGFAARKVDGTVVTWGCGIVNNILRYNTASVSISDIVGVFEISPGYLAKRANGSIFRIANGNGYTTGAITAPNPADKTVWIMSSYGVPNGFEPDVIALEMNPMEVITPSSMLAYSTTTVTYYSNRWERMAKFGVRYGLFANGVLVSTFIPQVDSMTYTFPNVILPNGVSSLSIGIAGVSVANTMFSFNVSVSDNPFVSPPDAPNITNVTINAATSSASVSFTLPSWNGGVAVNGMKYSLDGGLTYTSIGTTSPLSLSGLTSGSYDFVLVATNPVGDSYGTTYQITMCDPPSAPVITSVTGGNRTLTVNFTPPLVGSTGTSTNLDVVGMTSNTFTVSGNANPLLNGQYIASNSDSYNGNYPPYMLFDGNANTVWQSSPKYYSALFNPYTYVGSVSTVVESIGTVSGEWIQIRYPNPILITGYSFSSVAINYYPNTSWLVGSNNGTTWYPLNYKTGQWAGANNTSTYTINEFDSAGAYRFFRLIVTAVNSGEYFRLRNFTISGYPVASNSIVGYKYSLNGGAYFSKGTRASPLTISLLNNSSTYNVKMRAINAAGDSIDSNVSSNVTLGTFVPETPVLRSAVAGQGSMTLNFDIPYNGGSAITALEYSVTTTGGAWPSFVAITPMTSPFTITGLTNGWIYSVKLRARNAVGNSAESNIIENIAPKSVPVKPWVAGIDVSNKQLVVRWNEQLYNNPYYYGGSSVTAIKYSVNGSPYSFAPNWSNLGYVLLTGLENGTEYAIRFIAVNAIGDSLPSDPTIGIPCDVPSAPAITNIIAVDGSANVSFTQGSDGGRPITEYQYMLNNPFKYEIDSALFTGSRWITVPQHADFNLGTEDFTIEWYHHIPWVQSYNSRVFSFGSASTGISLAFGWYNVSNTRLCINNVWYDFGSSDPSPWQHIALSRVNGELRLFRNGVQVGSTLDCSMNINHSKQLVIANDESFTEGPQFFGYLAAFTYITGWGKYTGSFTPPLYPILSVPQGKLVLFVVGRNNPAIGTRGSTAVIPGFDSWGKQLPPGYFSPSYITIPNDTTSPISFGGLTNGTEYSVAIRAKNNAGFSEPSNKSVFTPLSVPDAPVINSVTYGNVSAVLDFSANVLSGNSPIIGYKLSTNNGPFVSVGLISSPYTVTGLVNGTSYSFRLIAVSAIGDSPSSEFSAYVIPRRVPDAPIITVTENVLQATVSFTQGASNGGSNILSYYYSYDGGDEVALSAPQDQTYNLVLGESRTFAVRVTNDVGSSATTTVSLTGKSFPDAPTITSIDAGDKSALVHFTDGSANFSAITGYKYKLDSGDYQIATLSGSDILIPDLSANVTYSVSIVAVNAIGVSESSNSWSVTPYTKPDAPVLNSATADNASVQFSFTSGLANNSPITAYKYSLNNRPYVTLPDLSTTVTLSDLSNGILYNIKVKATNIAGDSVASNSLSFMPYTIPDAPTIISVTAGNESADVYFTPGFFNGSNITQYKYALYGGSYDGTTFLSASELGSPIHIDNLVNGTVYTVTLLAVNAAGESNASNSSTSFAPFITQSTANPPLLQSVTVSDRSVSIFYVDDFNPGSAIIGYKYSLNGGPYYWFAQTSSPLELHDLENGVEYSITVKSVNNSGASVASPALTFTPVHVPETPIILNGVAGDSQVTLYLADLEDNGSAITEVQCSLNSGAFFSVDVSSNMIVIQGLDNGTEYTARIKCINALGESGISNVSEMMRPVGLPFPPTITNVVVGDEMVTLHFDEADGNGMPVLKYSYCLIDNGVAGLYLSTEDLSSPIVITGLTNGHTYAVQMKSLTLMGESVATTESEDFVPYGLPLAPIITKAEYANDILTVHFTEVNGNGKAVTDHLYSLDGTTYFSSSQLTSPLTISNLVIGASTTVFIKTQTDAGISVASNESTSFIAYTTPTSPLITNVASLDGALSVTFVDGSFNGTNKIGYKYSVDGTQYYWCNTTVSPVVITGLTNGTSYNVSLKTVTDRGETDAYTFATAVTPSNMQLPPNIISADASNATIVIGFTNPQLNGATITGYLYSLNGGADISASSVDMSNNKITITGLTNGTAYVVRIKSISSNGTSGTSNASKSVTPYATPSAPIISRVVTGSQVAYVHFIDGSLNGSPAILGYRYSFDNVNYVWSSVTTSPIPLTGLTNGLAYTVRLIAVTSVNQSAPSALSTPFVPFALPAPPTITSVVVGTASATVTFTDGVTNGRPLTGYRYSLNGGESVSVTPTNGSFTVTGLTVGTSYYVSMFAVNAAGTSIASVPSSTFMPFSVPGAPTIVSVQPAEKSVIVTVDNTNLNGIDFNGIPITGYKWAFSQNGVFNDVSVSPNATTFTISGLENGTSYQICVRSVCSVGVSPASALSAAFTPCTVPEAPTITSIVPYDERAQLFFTDGSNNGSAITGYKYSLDGITYYTALQKTSPLTLFSLTNSTSYQVYLKATNIAGDSSNSNLSDIAIPFGVPYAPVITDIIPGNGCAYVYFNPIDNNGSPVTGIKYSLGAAALDASGITSPITIPNLINKNSYNISIVATNAAGDSYASNIFAVTVGTPTVPVVTSVVASAKTLTVHFIPPVDNGSALTQYQWSVVGSTKFAKALGMTSPLTIGGLSNGTAYNIVIQAVNKNGASRSSNAIGNRVPFDLPGKMAISSVVPFFEGCTINFLPPPTNGAPILKYAYNISTDLTGAYVDLSGTTSPLTITGIPNNVSYTLKMIAYNAAGASVASAPSKAARFVYLPPAQPKITSVNMIFQTIFVNFTAPAIFGAPITSYKYSLNGGEFIDISSNVIPMMITGVQNNTNYTVAIRAVSAAGDSVASAASKPVSYVFLPPSAPVVSAITGGDRRAVITFTPPNVFNAPVTGYRYTLNGGPMLDASGLVSPITITGLTNDVSYNVLLYANSSAGMSPASAVRTVIPVYRVPDVPVVKSVIVTTDTASITLTLGAANGAPITSVMYSLDNGVTFTDSGNLTGAFVVTGLVSKQTYNLRAYTVNEVGQSAISPSRPFAMK